MKRFFWAVFTLALGMMLFIGSSEAIYAAGESTGMDVVMVLDLSGSMTTTDSNRVSLEGAKLFVDMMESANSRAGVVAFDSSVVSQQNLATMNSLDDKNNIKNVINSLQYGHGDTNIGEALDTAVKMLESSQNIGNKRMVLLFTDGNIDLDSNPSIESAAEKASLQQAKDATARARDEGITIYTIGLDAGQSAQFKMDPTLITEMAANTDGICKTVSSASELPDAFNAIFASVVDSEINDLGDITITDPNAFEERSFNIPNGSVLEANMVMITGGTGTLNEIELIDPNGNSLTPDGKSLLLTTSNNYNMLKMIGPQAGDWLLRIKGSQGCEIHLNLIFNYDVTIEASAVEDSSGNNAHVSARLMKKGTPVTDQALYNQMVTTANVTRMDGTTTPYSMTLDSNFNYICDVPVEEGETIKVVAHTEGANMYRDSPEIEFTRTAPAATPTPSPTPTPVPISVEEKPLPQKITIKGLLPNMAKDSLKLTDYFVANDPAVANLNFSAEVADKDILTASVNGNGLNFKGNEVGSSKVTVSATDADGKVYYGETEVEVQAIFKNLLIPIIIGVAALLLIVFLVVLIIILNKNKKYPMKGILYWCVSTDGGYSFGREDPYTLAFSGKTERLANIATDNDLLYMDLGNITVSGKKGGNTIIVENKTKTCELKDQFGAAKKTLILKDGDECRIDCTGEDGTELTLSLRYTLEEEY